MVEYDNFNNNYIISPNDMRKESKKDKLENR